MHFAHFHSTRIALLKKGRAVPGTADFVGTKIPGVRGVVGQEVQMCLWVRWESRVLQRRTASAWLQVAVPEIVA